MSTVKITGQPRDTFGKGAARTTRRAGLIPAVIYGRGSAVVHVSLPERELVLALRKSRVVFEVELAGETYVVAPRDVQRDPVRRIIEHLDLILIDRAEVEHHPLALPGFGDFHRALVPDALLRFDDMTDAGKR